MWPEEKRGVGTLKGRRDDATRAVSALKMKGEDKVFMGVDPPRSTGEQ